MTDDEALDVALVEDLDRSLTDDGEDEEPEVLKPAKGRRSTRSEVGLKGTDASTAPTRRNMRNSTLTIDDSVVEPHVAIPQAGENIFQFEEEPRQPPPKMETDKKGGNRKAWAKQKAKAQEGKDEDIRVTVDRGIGICQA